MNFRSKAVNIYLALMIFNFIPANSAKWGEMLDVNSHKTNKVVLAFVLAKARANAKKSNNTALWETSERKTYLFGPRNSKTVHQNSRLSTIPTFNMTKVNRYDNRGKYLELRKKYLNRKNNRYRYLFTYLENRAKNLAYASRCLKEELSHKMCWIFHETLPIWLPIRCQPKNLCMPHDKS